MKTIDRIRYWFDNTMSKGPIALIIWLFVLSAIVILIASMIFHAGNIFPSDEEGNPINMTLPEVMWMNLMHTMEPARLAYDEGNALFLGLMFLVALGGLFVVSSLIGILTTGMEAKFAQLRKGRSFVVEQGHTVILGWSPQIFTIISELVIANENKRRSCIAILSEKDKVEMEDEIKDQLGSTGHTKIVCRTGSPVDVKELEMINIDDAHSIIVLSPQKDDPDSFVLKSLLAITHNPGRKVGKYHIVAEIQNKKNLDVARMVGKDEVSLVSFGELVSRITVQCCRQSGLSAVHQELLDFDGDEIYFWQEDKLIGVTFGCAMMMYEASSIIGIKKEGGDIIIKPAMDEIIESGDKLIAISADDDTIKLSDRAEIGINAAAIKSAKMAKEVRERTLILGWNSNAYRVIEELDKYVERGSQILVVSTYDVSKDEIKYIKKGIKNHKINFKTSDSAEKAVLDKLNISQYDHVIVLSYCDNMLAEAADAKTLITLLHLRNLAEEADKRFSIVSEMLDARNVELARVARVDDLIVSNKLVSMMLSQLSENKHLEEVFSELFSAEGAEVYLEPASDYVMLDTPLNFYTVCESAKARGNIAIGYFISGGSSESQEDHGVVVNPIKSQDITFTQGDKIIVLA
ncbi:MAG: potassium transporter TrkA [bacterium]